MNQPGFFDLDERYAQLSKQGDPLERINNIVSWSVFKPVLKKLDKQDRKSNAGRKAYPSLMLFKMLIIQSLYNLSDEQVEFQVKDRLSFMRFLDISWKTVSQMPLRYGCSEKSL